MTFDEMLKKASPEDQKMILALAASKPPFIPSKRKIEDYFPDGEGIHELCTGYPIFDDFPQD